MKETRELQEATQARNEARDALRTSAGKLRARLAPRMIAADLAGLVAARAGAVFIKSGISKRRRKTAAIAGVVAIASAVALRASQKATAKKKR